MLNLQLLSFLLLFCIFSKVFGQKTDSLSNKSNSYLVEKLNGFQFDRQNPLTWIYLNAYIENAKKKEDYETLFYAYRSAIYYSDTSQKLAYSDSALIAAQNTGNPDIIGKSYYIKGSTYYEIRDYKSTLDNYLSANEVLKKSDDDFVKNQVTYGIAVVKLYLGYYEDALILIESPLNFFKIQNTSNGYLFYIRCLFRKGEIYQALKDYNKSKEVNLLGLQEAINHKELIQEHYFNIALGIDDYFSENYAHAIQNIEKAIPAMTENGYFEMEEKGHFYIAKSYLKLKQENKALYHFQKIDSLFVKNSFLPFEIRETYEWLIDNYKKKNNKDLQLYYINQLISVDKFYAENNQYLTYKIHKEYDTQRLLEEKRNLEKQFSNWQYLAIGFLAFMQIIAIFYFLKYRKVQKKNHVIRKQYDDLLNQTNETLPIISQPKKQTKEIPDEVVEDILNRLNQFEIKKEYLNRNIDQKSLADKFKTNTSYLSKIVNTYKETNFNTYLNKLRLNYVIELLKKEPKYRNYTIEALSEIAGFTSPRQFSDVFLAETGLRPTYFLEQIRKEKTII